MIELSSLPVEHPLRNTPLTRINAEYRNQNSKIWNRVLPTYNIANKTYNELAANVWTAHDIWRADETSI